MRISISLAILSEICIESGYYYRTKRMHSADCTKAFEWYQFEWPSVIYNPNFKVTIIQRQITQKQYTIEPMAEQ